jgi:hypothetical protein
MWYEAWDGIISDQVRIGHATSSHPDSTWTKDPNNPVLRNEIGRWDYPRVEFPNVIYDGDTYHMWYSGGELFAWRIGYATSLDGSSWTKDQGNPVLDLGSAGSWDNIFVGACSVIDSEASTYKMWYTGGNGVWDGKIGYATSDIPGGIDDNIATEFPKGFVLSQNYPNPFNPVTKIKFALPKADKVKIELYNTLGQRVETLLNQHMKVGNHEVEFNAQNLSSGVYFYRIEAGEFQDVKKLVLLR